MSTKEKIIVCEVGPRDGLQIAKAIMPTEIKVRWIAAIAAAGVPEIEAADDSRQRDQPRVECVPWMPTVNQRLFRGQRSCRRNESVFDGSNTTVYYLPGTTGWSNTFAGVSAVLWRPQIQASGANFGVQNNQFGFNITNGSTTNIPIVVEACTNLAGPVWIPLTNVILTNSFYFSDPGWTNYPVRFYGLGFP